MAVARTLSVGFSAVGASRYFAHGDRTDAAAEIRARAAPVKLEAGRHNATNKAGLEDAAKHLGELAAQVGRSKKYVIDLS